MGRKYRFFTHFHKQLRKGSIHFRGKCFLVDKVELRGVDFVESKLNLRQPYYVMQGFAEKVISFQNEGSEVVTGVVYGKCPL